MIKRFIDRPVLSLVISIFIVFLGIIGINILPITQYPSIAPTTVQISASYPGANAETVLESVVIPIEEQVNGVEGMNYITSTASNDGSANISVLFKQGIDPDIATVNVQNSVARATPLLPAEVTRTGVVTKKRQTDALMFLSFYTANPKYDDVYLQNYLNINIIPEIKRISGVGDASVFGAKNYSMRIWISPEKMANYGLTPGDVIRAINDQSQQATPGNLGENNGEAFQYVIKYSGKYNEEKQYKDIIVKTGENGELLRLGDVADIELSAFSYSVLGKTEGSPSFSVGIYQTPGSNAQIIIKEIQTYLENKKASFPDGIDYVINYNTNEFLSASMEHVIKTLLEAFVLVFIVVLVFLQDFKSTLIPAIAVPVSIVGTFFFLNLFGFSINLLTLFALILAIGIVVDDAIVVVEAVHAKLETKKFKTSKEATYKAMDGISGAIISITLVMAAVFVPVTFIPGPSGVFFKQFGITLIIAILISALNALTLSPMLSALLLKPHHDDDEHATKTSFLQRFFIAFNAAFDSMIKKYGQAVSFTIKHKWVAFAILLLSVGGIYYVSKTTPTGFVPNEDRKILFANIELPAGSSLDRTYEILEEMNEKASHIEGVNGVSFVAGRSFISGAGSNYGIGFVRLNDWEDRNTEETSIETITKKLFGMAATIPEAKMIFFGPPSVPGFSFNAGFEVQVLDKNGRPVKELDETSRNYIAKLVARPEILYAQSSINTGFPQLELTIDKDVAFKKGVQSSEIFSALSGYLGGVYAADFTKFGKQFRVMVQAKPDDRATENDLNKIYVRNNKGDMIPITQLVSLKRVYGPQTVSRFNLFNAASITGAPAPGFSSGDAIKAVQETAKELPAGYDIDFSGLTREEISSGSQTTMILVIVVIFVYLLLSAQYESFVLPFSILLSLPVGMFGAFLSQKLAGLEINIYFQIALIMLIGLLAKNAILIVEFALQERKNGNSIIEAAILGAKERLRPILMTSFAFIAGLMPLVLSSGIGANGNKSLATGAAYGMLIGTFLGLLVIPVLFVIFQTIQEKIKPVDFVKEEENE
ncbi:MAG: efflux RND transporter permease subunit [Chitinophagales bacterium]|nr:efflux RND transporter permease subunit [Chitinophagales bacterium]